MTLTLGRRLALVPILCALTIGGCSSGGGGSGGDAGADTVSGTASAPAGAVAYFEYRPVWLATLDLLLSPAAAAITGLEPVTGATVELIRVDNDGNPVGEVLASTVTSLTGDYTLRLPAGVNLAGNLVLRINGTGGAQMRAQAVDASVNISPVSEFVLRRFIDDGVDLDNLVTDSVARLTGQLEEFDLTATADLDSMLAALEEETGDFVDGQLDLIAAGPGDAAALAGTYRAVFLGFGLHDDDQQYGVGTFSSDLEVSAFAFSDNGGSEVGIEFTAAEFAYTNQTTVTGNGTTVSFVVEVDNESDTFPGNFDGNGVLSVQGEFEEDIDGDFGWRHPPSLVRLQKAPNANLFFSSETSAGVRYLTVDTDGDDVKDAVDPAAREGDEVFKELMVLAQAPAGATTSDLDGDFGRVFFSMLHTDTGHAEVESESNVLSFSGAGGTFDAAQAQSHLLGRSGYTASTTPAEAGVAFTLAADGDVSSIGGEAVDGFVNAGFDLLAIAGADSVDNAQQGDELVAEASYELTLAVKLPLSQLDLSNREYRILFLGVSLGASQTVLSNLRFDSMFNVNNDGTSGTLAGRVAEIGKATPIAEVEADVDQVQSMLAATVSVGANGAATIVISDSDGTATLHGYFSHDGSLGVFQTRFTETGQNDPDELGVALLVQR